MKINIVMVEPEIPQNTGNIARTCAATGGKLHLVKPLGFQLSDKYLKRAGLDYWDKLDIEEHDSLEKFLEKYEPEKNNMYFMTTKGKNVYSKVDIEDWIKSFGQYMKHMHIHNNYGDEDSHFAINKGTMDVISILNKLKDKDITISLEITDVNELRDSLDILYKNGFIKLRELAKNNI